MYSDLAKQYVYALKNTLHIVNSMKSYVNKILPENVTVQTAYTGKPLRSCFKTEDKTKFEHQHNIIYQVKCSAENCPGDYIGESARHVSE